MRLSFMRGKQRVNGWGGGVITTKRHTVIASESNANTGRDRTVQWRLFIIEVDACRFIFEVTSVDTGGTVNRSRQVM